MDVESDGDADFLIGSLDGDGRIDPVEGEGEVADADRVFLATDELPVDTATPSGEPFSNRATRCQLPML